VDLRAISNACAGGQREFFIDNLLVRIHFIIVMMRWTGRAPWECESPFPGSLTSTFQSPPILERIRHIYKSHVRNPAMAFGERTFNVLSFPFSPGSGNSLQAFTVAPVLHSMNRIQRLRGGLVSKAHRLLYHSTLGLRVIKKKKNSYDFNTIEAGSTIQTCSTVEPYSPKQFQPWNCTHKLIQMIQA